MSVGAVPLDGRPLDAASASLISSLQDRDRLDLASAV